jgi:hypothetical protein
MRSEVLSSSLLFGMCMLCRSIFSQDSLNIRKVGELQIPGGEASDVCLRDTLAFVAAGDWGVRIVNVAHPSAPHEVGFQYTFHTVWSVESFDHYVMAMGLEEGVETIDLADPHDPQIIFVQDTASTCLAVQDGFAYVGLSMQGIQILDLSDPSEPEWMGLCSTPWGGYDVAAGSGLLGVTDGMSGWYLFDVSDPTTPIEVYSLHQGVVFFHSVEMTDSLLFLDVHGVTALRLVIYHLGNPWSPAPACTLGLTSDVCNMTYSQGHLFLSMVDHGFMVYDVHDPSRPSLSGYYGTQGATLSVCVQGNYAYVADRYTLGIYDCSEALHLDRPAIRERSPTISLGLCYPNPFNSSTTLQFELGRPADVLLEVFDVKGAIVRQVRMNGVGIGAHAVCLRAEDLPSGAYFARLTAGWDAKTRRLVLIR